tara:strand:+ start:7707 stop:8468 length:762 start_codon:yes stop_codon:yes gene_type:complete
VSNLFVSIVFTIIFWWFTTIFLLRATRNISKVKINVLMILSTALLILGFTGLFWSVDKQSITGVYVGFTSVLLIWFWLESTFLVGWVTGIRKVACPKDVTEFKRAWLAFLTINHHEYLLLATLFCVWFVTINGENFIGLYAFLTLWCMRVSSKLNVFLGVRNLYEEFLPTPIRHLSTYFRKKNCNPIFPITFLGAFLINLLFWDNAFQSEIDHMVVHFGLLATLLSLGIFEHVVMVLPFQLNKLWSLGLNPQK